MSDDERFSCAECGRTDVPREDAFPCFRDGGRVRVCRSCRETNFKAVRDVVERKVAEAREMQQLRDPEEEARHAAAKRLERFDSAQRNVARYIGERYLRCCRENLEGDPAALGTLWSAADARESVLLCGPHGVGKTHAAAVIYREAQIDGLVAFFRVATELVGELKRAIDRDEVDLVVSRLRQLDLLVIDDLAMERPTDWVLEQFCRVIDWRYRDGSFTVITSNKSPAELGERYGDRVRSRILGLIGRRLVHLEGRDRREDEILGVTPPCDTVTAGAEASQNGGRA